MGVLDTINSILKFKHKYPPINRDEKLNLLIGKVLSGDAEQRDYEALCVYWNSYHERLKSTTCFLGQGPQNPAIEYGRDPLEGYATGFMENQLCSLTLRCGMSRSGKSTQVRKIIMQIWEKLHQYTRIVMFSNEKDEFDDLIHWARGNLGINPGKFDEKTPWLNPLYVEPGCTVFEHRKDLLSQFTTAYNISSGSGSQMYALRALTTLYEEKCGVGKDKNVFISIPDDQYPTMFDFHEIAKQLSVPHDLESRRQKELVIGRTEGFIMGCNGETGILACTRGITGESLLKNDTFICLGKFTESVAQFIPAHLIQRCYQRLSKEPVSDVPYARIVFFLDDAVGITLQRGGQWKMQ